MATILTIDTASPFCSVAVARFTPVLSIDSVVSAGKGDHFEQLPSLVAEVLHRACLKMSDVNLIGVGVGPGSFTGIRIGMSFAKGLAWAQSLPLRGFCSLAAIAYGATSEGIGGREVAVIADAGRDELFFSRVKVGAAGRAGEPCIIPRVDLPTHLSGITELITPQGALFESDKVKEVLPLSVRFSLCSDAARGGALLVHASPGLTEGVGASVSEELETLSSIISLEPSYLRQVAAKTIREREAEKSESREKNPV